MGKLTLKHIKKVWHATRVLLERDAEHLTKPDLGDLLFRFSLDPLMDEVLHNAQTKLAELNAVHDKAPVTTNHYFQDTVTKMRRDRDLARMTPKLMKLLEENDEVLDFQNFSAIILTAYPKEEPDMDRAAAEDVFDHVNAFYKVCQVPYRINIGLIRSLTGCHEAVH